MSLDYPFYEELCRLKHRGAKWWMIGDRLYYLGLISAMVAVSGAGPALVAGLFGEEWHWLWMAFGGFLLGVLVFIVGASLKVYAYRLAERDGISFAEVYERAARGREPPTGDSP